MDTTDIDLKHIKKCVHCGQGMMHSNHIHFYEVKVSQCIIDIKSVQQMHGLEMQLGAAAPLARVFAPSTRVAVRMPGYSHFVCSECVDERVSVAALLDKEDM